VTEPLLRFDRFAIDRSALELRHDGERVTLGPQPVRLLLLLAERQGELVTRHECYRALWPQGDVDVDRALNTLIRQVRMALREHAAPHDFIRTYPRRGYRLELPAPADRPTPRRLLGRRPRRALAWAGAVMVLALSALALRGQNGDPPRVVVLPFDRPPDDPSQAEAISESILTTLAAIDPAKLQVLGWTPADIPDGESPAAFARRVFDADYAVLGSVQRLESTVVVLVRLIRTDDGRVLWADRYEGLPDAAASVRREVATRVAASLNAESVDRLQAVTAPDPDVELDYLQARYLLRHPRVDRRPEAVPYLERVLARDSTFAPAHAALAEAYFWDDRYAEASAAVGRALRFDPGEPDAWFIRSGLRLVDEWDWGSAEADARRAISARPGRPEYHQGLAFILSTAGRHGEAVRELEVAVELDPVSPSASGDLGYILFLAKRYDQAAALCRRTVKLEPQAIHGHDCAYAALSQLGRWEDALVQARALLRAWGLAPDSVLGDPRHSAREGVAAFRRWRVAALRSAVERRDYPPFWLAVAQAEAGDLTDAVRTLELASHERSMGYVTLAVDPRFDSLRNDPRFIRLVADLRSRSSGGPGP